MIYIKVWQKGQPIISLLEKKFNLHQTIFVERNQN